MWKKITKQKHFFDHLKQLPVHSGGRDCFTLLHLTHTYISPLELKKGEKEVQTLLFSTHTGGGGRWQAGSPKPAPSSDGANLANNHFIRHALGGTSRGQVGSSLISNKEGHSHGLELRKPRPPSAGHHGNWTNHLEGSGNPALRMGQLYPTFRGKTCNNSCKVLCK